MSGPVSIVASQACSDGIVYEGPDAQAKAKSCVEQLGAQNGDFFVVGQLSKVEKILPDTRFLKNDMAESFQRFLEKKTGQPYRIQTSDDGYYTVVPFPECRDGFEIEITRNTDEKMAYNCAHSLEASTGKPYLVSTSGFTASDILDVIRHSKSLYTPTDLVEMGMRVCLEKSALFGDRERDCAAPWLSVMYAMGVTKDNPTERYQVHQCADGATTEDLFEARTCQMNLSTAAQPYCITATPADSLSQRVLYGVKPLDLVRCRFGAQFDSYIESDACEDYLNHLVGLNLFRVAMQPDKDKKDGSMFRISVALLPL